VVFRRYFRGGIRPQSSHAGGGEKEAESAHLCHVTKMSRHLLKTFAWPYTKSVGDAAPSHEPNRSLMPSCSAASTCTKWPYFT
jgi:hypothetical protein